MAYLEEAEDALAGAGVTTDCPSVKHFLNRLLGMPVTMQNKVFTHFMALLEEKVSNTLSSTCLASYTLHTMSSRGPRLFVPTCS